MFEQVLALFGRLAEGGPVVLVIEDVHWSDRSTRDLLSFLIGNQRVLDGVLIVVTFRSESCTAGIRCGRCWPSWAGSAGWRGWRCLG